MAIAGSHSAPAAGGGGTAAWRDGALSAEPWGRAGQWADRTLSWTLILPGRRRVGHRAGSLALEAAVKHEGDIQAPNAETAALL